jgi:hypothetical protein
VRYTYQACALSARHGAEGETVNKLLLLTVACALLISSVGATATVSATQIGHSPIYYFDVMNNGTVVGQVIVNTANAKTPTYVLVANGLTSNTKYTFGYTASGDMRTLGTAKTTTTGALVMHGTFPAADVKDLQSAQFWVTETPPGGSYLPIMDFSLHNSGWFVAKIACDYSTDGGVTWYESGHTSGIIKGESGTAQLSDLGVPYGAVVKIHVIVVGGKDRIGSEVFQYHSAYASANYRIYGTTLKPTLEYLGYSD